MHVTETWNTRRLYTAAGQIIIATWHAADGAVTFNDISRGITGELNATFPDHAPLRMEQSVMLAYDHGRYKPSRRAWVDGMDRDGCNATSKASL